MRLPVDRLRTAVLAQLTGHEAQRCVIYLATTPIERGETLSFPRLTFACSSNGYVTFVDLEPTANWGHACCYMCLDVDSDNVDRIDAQFPPFTSAKPDRPARQWQVIYRAPGVPDALLMAPEA